MRKIFSTVILIFLWSLLLAAGGSDFGEIIYLTDGAPDQADDKGNTSSTDPSYSPDGKHIVFSTFADSFQGTHKNIHHSQLAEYSFADKTVKFLTDGDYYSTTPHYRADAATVVFSTRSWNFGQLQNKMNSLSDRIAQIAEIDRKTGKIRYITDGDNHCEYPRYSPKGDKIVFQTQAHNFSGDFQAHKNEWGDPVNQIAEWDRATDTITYIAVGNEYCERPRYSPDGNSVVFQTGASNFKGKRDNSQAQLALWNRKTKSVTLITNEEYSCQDPVFSPDGKNIAFTTNSQISLFDIRTGKVTTLTGGDKLSNSPEFSRDSRKIVFVTTSTNYTGSFTARSDETGEVAQIAEYDLAAKKTIYITNGDGNSLSPSYGPVSSRVIMSTQANNFSGKHTPRHSVSFMGTKTAEYQIAEFLRKK